MNSKKNYIQSHETNKKIFQDTLDWIKKDSRLSQAVQNTIEKQFIWKEGSECPVKDEGSIYERNTSIFASSKRSFKAAAEYARQGKKTAVLNFADNYIPGGEVINGANTQEECLCRCSTLYPCLTDSKCIQDFYGYHLNLYKSGSIDFTGNNDLIYSPDVIVCKSDTAKPHHLREENWYKVDVITCAAPNLCLHPISNDDEYKIHLSRFTAILTIAKAMKCQVVILGAFGCGVFANHPEIVASAASEAIKAFPNVFNTIEFAVFTTDQDKENFNTFSNKFGQMYIQIVR